ncbi:maltotransferase domain-containing protein [Ferruginivarius sediminum]|uniref:maltotransferase domain-containing protein n=1 Tax=Ferruginivarius sediminum TaxID=2661937 RepID=UPI001F4EE4E7|nr:maltotransferase domain-containing protein [Ferruginivarius sediminum]
MAEGPRIYNLFPLLAGAVDGWPEHLPRIAGMGFDWILLNPVFYPGFSGSIYATKDHERLHPIVAGDRPDRDPAEALAGFCREAKAHGLKVMLDLVADSVARDSVLAGAHPDWFVREPDGALRPPRQGDPLDPRGGPAWGDLAEIDYGHERQRAEQIRFWADFVATYLEAGISGFRCQAAHRVPVAVWKEIIAHGKGGLPDAVFAADTLGAAIEDALTLEGAGFDYVFNSLAWWNFRDRWLLEEHARLRGIAPTIGFPESHATGRLAQRYPEAEAQEREKRYRQHYLLAAAFSSGVMVPMGFEYGFAEPLDAVAARPGDWTWQAGNPPFDLTAFIADINATKRANGVLNVEGPVYRVTDPDSPLVALVRHGGPTPARNEAAGAVLVNMAREAAAGIRVGHLLAELGGRIESLADVTPGAGGKAVDPAGTLTLPPLTVRLLIGEARKHPHPAPSKRESERRLGALAEQRVVIEHVHPEIDGGRHPVKRVVGDVMRVTADIFGDGHDKIAACIRYKAREDRGWREVPMHFVDNDRWAGEVPLTRNTRYLFTIEAWRDPFESWRAEFGKKHDAGQPISLELTEGRHLVENAAAAAGKGQQRKALDAVLKRLDTAGDDQGAWIAELLSSELRRAMREAAPRTNVSRYDRELEVVADRRIARFGAWYELFPRSMSDDPRRHGTFDDVVAKLPYVRDMGFDVLYFPPIHPVGGTNRKGRNNALVAGPDDPGSPYAIGSHEGGHDAIHPALGTLDDFRGLVDAAHDHGLEVALDFAIQCSPDHPWLKEHPEWFDWRPDGSIKFAENPPKKYEDIVNVHFYRKAKPSLWYELRDVLLFWVDQGVKIFRVDNPHTKPFPFWEWVIREVQDRDPEAVFLSEAFTRPKVMYKLAKLGFTQSYTYFTWRNEKQELIDYLTELTQQEPREYFRPNFFTNTPDINPRFLQSSGRPGFVIRATLAATLVSSYGIYSGFELCEATPIPGREEYLNAEKYEIKAWDWDHPGNIRDFIARLNRIRRENPAFHDHLTLRFFNAWDDHILVYGRITEGRDNAVLVAVNLDPHAAHGAHFEVPLWEFDLPDHASIAAEDLLTGQRFRFHGKVQHVWLDPQVNPCAVWRLIPPGFGEASGPS